MRSLLIGVILAGCTEVPPECAESPLPSVRLTVVDASGREVYGAQASYSADGAPPAPCEDWTGTDPICGVDVAGDLSVHVEADDFAPWDGVVFVPEGACHVEPQDVRVVLAPVDACQDTAPAPAVAVSIVGSEGEYLTDVAVTWSGADGGGDCDPPVDLGGEWTCGWEQSGAIAVTAAAAGHATRTASFDVPAGDCHPETIETVLSLDWN